MSSTIPQIISPSNATKNIIIHIWSDFVEEHFGHPQWKLVGLGTSKLVEAVEMFDVEATLVILKQVFVFGSY